MTPLRRRMLQDVAIRIATAWQWLPSHAPRIAAWFVRPSDLVNSDFRDLLRIFNEGGVRYLIVGGYAVMVHTEPRYTKDLHIWVEPQQENAARLLLALAEFGAPVSTLSAADFTEPEVFFQIGVEPVRVDIMTSNLGLDFRAAWDRKLVVDFGGEAAPVLGRQDVIATMSAAGRPRDRKNLKRFR